MKKLLRKIWALTLVLCCLTAAIQPAAAAEKSWIQSPVVSKDRIDYQGSFFWQDSQLYVELATLKGMDNDIGVCYEEAGNSLCVYRKMHPKNAIIPNPEIATVLYPMEKVLVTDRGIFVPFAQSLEALHLHPTADREKDRLVITEEGKAKELPQILEDIYKESCYNMSYWKDADNYRTDVVLAELIKAIRDRKLLSFAFGEANYESYREAFSRLIMPQSMEEVDFSTDADETLGAIDNVLAIGKDIADFFMREADIDLMGSFKDTYETISKIMGFTTGGNELLDIEDQIEMGIYFDSARVEEEGIIRALDKILPETTFVAGRMKTALEEVLDTYQKQSDPVWIQVAKKMSQKIGGLIDELALGYLFAHTYLFDLGNALTDFYIGTGQQVSATIQASRYLDVQTCCERAFSYAQSSYQFASRKDKGEYLQTMVDLTNLYLRAGLRAQEAMAQVDSMKAATNHSITKLKQAQEDMRQFTSDIIYYDTTFAAAEEWLVSGYKADRISEELYVPKPYTMADLPDMPVFITVTWREEVDGQRMHFIPNMTGTLDNGANVQRVGGEGEFMANHERVAAYSGYGKWFDLEIMRMDSVLDVKVMHHPDTPYDAPGFAKANVDIHIYTPISTLAVIAANPAGSAFAGSVFLEDASDFISSTKGLGIATIRLDHGVVKRLNSQTAAQAMGSNEAEGWAEEQYTPDGQLQSSELYNADGYILESRWYDNGECTAYTLWTYNEHNHLTLVRTANLMDPDEVQLIFENTYSNGELQHVRLYNAFGTLLGEGPTAYDAAAVVGVEMLYVKSPVPRP